jgi:hypothetical protein
VGGARAPKRDTSDNVRAFDPVVACTGAMVINDAGGTRAPWRGTCDSNGEVPSIVDPPKSDLVGNVASPASAGSFVCAGDLLRLVLSSDLCVCVRACVSVCVCVCVRERGRQIVCVCDLLGLDEGRFREHPPLLAEDVLSGLVSSYSV